MKAKCTVTFEFPLRPSVTWEGEIEANEPNTIASRAIKIASRELLPRSWSSMTFVITSREGHIDDRLSNEIDVPLPFENEINSSDCAPKFPTVKPLTKPLTQLDVTSPTQTNVGKVTIEVQQPIPPKE